MERFDTCVKLCISDDELLSWIETCQDLDNDTDSEPSACWSDTDEESKPVIARGPRRPPVFRDVYLNRESIAEILQKDMQNGAAISLQSICDPTKECAKVARESKNRKSRKSQAKRKLM